MVERDYIIQCLSYVSLASQCLRAVPNETWNKCIDLDYEWTKDLCNTYTALRRVQDSMQHYLDTEI